MRKTTRWSLIIHGSILALMVVVPLVAKIIEHFTKPKHEIVAFIDLSVPMEAPDEVEPIEDEAPKTVENDIPDPVVKKPPPKKPKKKKERLKKPNEIKIGKRIVNKPVDTPRPKPDLTPEEIERMLKADLPTNNGTLLNSDLPGWYYGLVQATFHDQWAQPGGLSISTGDAQLSIRVHRDGTVSNRKLIKKTGVAAMDQSVMNAANAVKKLKNLPGTFSGDYIDITITFVLGQ